MSVMKHAVGWFNNPWSVECRGFSDVFRVSVRCSRFRLARRNDIGASEGMARYSVRGFGKPLQRNNRIGRRNRCRHKERRFRIDKGGKAADDGTGNKSNTKCCTDQSHVAGALTSRRDVGHGRLCDRHRRARYAINDPAKKQNPQRAGKTRHERTNCCSAQRQNDDGLATNAVTQFSPHRSEHELCK